MLGLFAFLIIAITAFAAEQHGTAFQITKTATSYTIADNSYDSSDKSLGVRFYFDAPSDGNFTIVASENSGGDFFLNSGCDASYSSCSSRQNFYGSNDERTYSLTATQGQRFYFYVSDYNSSYSHQSQAFEIRYAQAQTLTLTSASAQCSTSVKQVVVQPGGSATIGGMSAGGRPNGWKVKSGSVTFIDSSASIARVELQSDAEIELQCGSTNLIDITKTSTTYTPDTDYYLDPNSPELRFRYTAPSAGVYAIRAKNSYSARGYMHDYGTDAAFSTTPTSTLMYSGDSTTIYFQATAGQSFYSSYVPYTTSYKSYSISVFATEATLITIKGTSIQDTAILGEPIEITAVMDSGSTFKNWKVESGTGTFRDSTSFTTIFTPTSKSVTISVVTTKGAIYNLTSKISGYTFEKNSSMGGGSNYGIRTVFNPSDTATYVLITNTNYSYDLGDFDDDNTFTTSSRNTTCSSYGSCKYLFNANKGEKKYFLLTQNYQPYIKDSIYAHVVKTIKVCADTSGTGTARIGLYSYNCDSSYVAGDTIPISASTTTQRFDHWKVVSGSCTITDSTEANTDLLANSDCKIKAYFKQGSIYQITSTDKDYFANKHYYSGINYNSGVIFYITSSKDAGYVVNFKFTGTTYLYQFDSSDFSNYNKYDYSSYSISDTVNIKAGDTIFYNAKAYYEQDTITVSYKTIKTYNITASSASEHCSTNDSTFQAFEGSERTISATSEKGYRPNGWKIVSGKYTIVDSSASAITFIPKSDVSLQVKCSKSNIIALDSVLRSYTTLNDFYEIAPSSGVRFQYKSTSTEPYVVQIKGTNFKGYLYDYANDSTFYSYNTYYVKSSGTPYSSAFFTPTASGETRYFKVTDYNNNEEVFQIRVTKPAYVTNNASNEKDTLVLNDSLAVVAPSKTGYRVKKWKVTSGSGTFDDSTASATYYIPKSVNSTIDVEYETLPIYTLSDKEKTFTFSKNGISTTFHDNTIRTSYTSKDSGTFVLIWKGDSQAKLLQLDDSTSTSYISYSYYYLNNEYQKYAFTLQSGEKTYFYFTPYYATLVGDSIYAKVIPTNKIYFDTIGSGYTTIDGYSATSDFSTIPGDSLLISAQSRLGYKFHHWSSNSKKCTLADSTKPSTTLYTNGSCRVTATFNPGTVYKITNKPTEYSTDKHYYSISASQGVRFSFVAPEGGTYAFVVSRDNSASLACYRYPSSDFYSYSSYNSYASPTYVDTLTMAKGDSTFFIVKNSYYYDSLKTFWISYSTTKSSLTITADSNGTATPTQYNPIWNKAKYGITAYGRNNYRFSKWEVLSGSPNIEDLNAPRTLVSVTGDAKINALFRKSTINKISKKVKTLNFQTHYYDESTNGVYMTWTPSDSNYYIIRFEPVDSLSAILLAYANDSTFRAYSSTQAISGESGFMFKGTPKVPMYWSLVDSSAEAVNKSFKVKISNPYILQVKATNQGAVAPNGTIATFPGADTTISARPYGGYVFDKWVIDSGSVKIDDVNKASTKFTVTDSFCIVRPSYTLDLSVQPELSITGMDLSNHPAICAQVDVTDKNSGKSIVGMDSSNFILYQDNTALPIQATTLQAVSGTSVALVIDESGSMSGTAIENARKAVNQFIDEMGPYDRTAIVGFDGSVFVRQKMTSDKDLLYAAARQIAATGGTNINDGAYQGLQELSNETNPTTVIIFSDGYGSGYKTNQEVINFAKKQGTTIFSIGIGSSVAEDPLKYIAEGTGGTFTVAPSSDQLSSIYSDIQSSVQSRYVLCYESPDQVLDDDKHEVIIKTNFYGKNASDTTQWREDYLPPKITLTQATSDMIGESQPAGDSIVIEAYISAKTAVNTATIYIRKSSITSIAFKAESMVNVHDSLWQFVIAESEVVSPGFDFYIIAQEVSGLIGKTPTIPAPSREPYTIPVDNDVPIVKVAKMECVDTTSGFGKIQFSISDSNGVFASYIYYKDSLDILFFEKAMNRVSDTTETWLAKIPAEHFRNGSAEYYVRAIDSTGAAVRWPKSKSKFLAACEAEEEPQDTTKKDTAVIVSNDSIAIFNAEDSKSKISRSTQEVKIKVWTDSISTKKDTITVKLSCLRSGDTESGIKLVKKSTGKYETLKNIPKDEFPASKNNGVISCEVVDTLVAEYKNPTTKKIVRDTVAISDFVALSYQFLELKEDVDLDSVSTSSVAKFRLRVTTTSPKIGKVDTIKVTLFTNKGDSLTVKAIETDESSAVFDAKGAFHFVEDKESLKDSLLDEVFDFTKSRNRIAIRAQLGKDSSKVSDRDSLIVYSSYIPADSAEIYDKNLDGKADFVRIHFKKPLKKNIESIDSVFWNKGSGEYRMIKESSLKVSNDSMWVEAKLEKAFKYGYTIADKSNPPYARIHKNKDDISQPVTLTDKVGAVPFKAVKHPGEVSVDDYLTPDLVIPPDTLVITMSEKIKRTGKESAWKNLFRVSASCKEDTASRAIRQDQAPTIDSTGLVWTIVLGDFSILVGNCITTDPDAEYIGFDKNGLGRGGVSIEGKDGTLYLYDVSPNPSVSGLGKKAKWLPPKAKKFEDVPDTLSTIAIYSIAPYKASIYIYDNAGQFVSHFTQKFGYNGEMEDPLRGDDTRREKLGYLHWNQRTSKDRKVATGIYVWKIFFTFDDGHSEIRTLKTGVKRLPD